MNETHKFKEETGESVQAFPKVDGRVELAAFGTPWLTTEQARQFAIELIKLANEIEATQ